MFFQSYFSFIYINIDLIFLLLQFQIKYIIYTYTVGQKSI